MIQWSELIEAITVILGLDGLVVSWGHDEFLGEASFGILVLERADCTGLSHSVLELRSKIAASLSAGRSWFLSLGKAEIFQLFVAVFQGLTQGSGQEVGVFSDRGVNIDLCLGQTFWLLSYCGLPLLDDVDMVILIQIELYWERNVVLVYLFGAVEEDGGLELIVRNQWRSAVSLKSTNLEASVWHLKFKKLLVYLVGRVLNNDDELRFITIWRVIFVILLS